LIRERGSQGYTEKRLAVKQTKQKTKKKYPAVPGQSFRKEVISKIKIKSRILQGCSGVYTELKGMEKVPEEKGEAPSALGGGEKSAAGYLGAR